MSSGPRPSYADVQARLVAAARRGDSEARKAWALAMTFRNLVSVAESTEAGAAMWGTERDRQDAESALDDARAMFRRAVRRARKLDRDT